MSPRQSSTRTVVLDAEQVRALASNERLRVYQAFETVAPASVSDVARTLGAKSKSLYYHVNALVEAGLLVPHSTRPAGSREETLYAPVAERIEIAPTHDDPAYTGAIADLAGAVLRRAERLHRRAVASPDVVLTGPDRERGILTTDVRLTPSKRRELNRAMVELVERAMEMDDPEGERTYTLAVVFSPTA